MMIVSLGIHTQFIPLIIVWWSSLILLRAYLMNIFRFGALPELREPSCSSWYCLYASRTSAGVSEPS